MRLPFLDHAAVLQDGAEMAGIIVRIGIIGVDDVFHLGGERKHLGIADRTLRERTQSDTAMDKTGRQEIRHRELGRVAIAWALFVGERFPQPVHRPLRHLAHDLLEVLGLDAPCR